VPILLGLLAALGLFAVSKPSLGQGSDRVLVLLRAAMPFGGPVVVGSVVALLAEHRDAFAPGGIAPPIAFKVRVVGVPDSGTPNYTAVFLSPVLGAQAGEFLEFAADKIQNVST